MRASPEKISKPRALALRQSRGMKALLLLAALRGVPSNPRGSMLAFRVTGFFVEDVLATVAF